MPEHRYDRGRAVEYAHRWAFGRNPAYADFSAMGGDCTNFISQCLHAGGAPMNHTPVTGWFYYSLSKRAPAWSGVEELCRFLVRNTGAGPYASVAGPADMIPGDVVQLSFDGTRFSHSLFVVAAGDGDRPPTPDDILVATHSDDSDNRPLSSWIAVPRYLHIQGIR